MRLCVLEPRQWVLTGTGERRSELFFSNNSQNSNINVIKPMPINRSRGSISGGCNANTIYNYNIYNYSNISTAIRSCIICVFRSSQNEKRRRGPPPALGRAPLVRPRAPRQPVPSRHRAPQYRQHQRLPGMKPPHDVSQLLHAACVR